MANATPQIDVSKRIASRRLLMPLVVTIALILWTIAVSPRSKYGDSWAILPALISLPVVFLWHIGLVALLKGQRAIAMVCGAIHFLALVPIWFYCLMSISKDSLVSGGSNNRLKLTRGSSSLSSQEGDE